MGEEAGNVKKEGQQNAQDSNKQDGSKPGGGNQSGGNQSGGNQGGQGGQNRNQNQGNRGRGGPGGQGGGGGGRKGGPGGNSRFSGGRGGQNRGGGGGPGGNQGGGGGSTAGGNMGGGGPGGNMVSSSVADIQMQAIKMSESMMEGMMDDSILGGRGGAGGGGGSGNMNMNQNRNRGAGGRGPGNRSGGGGPGGGMQNRSQDDRLMERLMALKGPTHELPPIDLGEKKFSGRNRLYVGNLTNDITEEEIQQMFNKYGETNEIFINKEKNFAFLRLDYHVNAEKAKREVDGMVRKGRVLKVRFAPHSSMVKVKNLTPYVTNELLAHAFSVFGDLERATVIVDDRGKPTGEGIVEFSRKPSAQQAIRKCTDGCYFLTSSLRPVVVEPFEPNDEVDGYPEKNLPKKSPDFYAAREIGPRFATPGSFEHEYGTRWKQLYEIFKQKEESLKSDMTTEEKKLDAQMEFARFEHETEMLREQLRLREADRERQKREWEIRERQAEEQRAREEEIRRRQEEEMALRIRRQEEELHRRQQENSIFKQEQAMRHAAGAGVGGAKNFDGIAPEREGYPPVEAGANLPVDPKSFMDQYANMERNNRGGYNDERGQLLELMEMRVDMGNMGNMNNMGNMGNMGNNRAAGGGGGGRWQGGNDRQRPDEYPNKRRRY